MYMLLSFRNEMKEAAHSCTIVDDEDDCISIMTECIIIIIIQNDDIFVYLMAGICSHTRKVQH